MSEPNQPEPNKPQRIDPKTLTPEQIREAIIENGRRWGSYAYYIEDEIARAERDPEGVVVTQWVFADGTTEPMRAYYKTPEQRRFDAERQRAQETSEDEETTR